MIDAALEARLRHKKRYSRLSLRAANLVMLESIHGFSTETKATMHKLSPMRAIVANWGKCCSKTRVRENKNREIRNVRGWPMAELWAVLTFKPR